MKKDNDRRRMAEGEARTMAWEISQAKDAKKVRVNVRVPVEVRVKVMVRNDKTRQDKTRQEKTRQDKTRHRHRHRYRHRHRHRRETTHKKKLGQTARPNRSGHKFIYYFCGPEIPTLSPCFTFPFHFVSQPNFLSPQDHFLFRLPLVGSYEPTLFAVAVLQSTGF